MKMQPVFASITIFDSQSCKDITVIHQLRNAQIFLIINLYGHCHALYTRKNLAIAKLASINFTTSGVKSLSFAITYRKYI